MKAYAQPVAYIRRSVARRGDPGDVSREFQVNKVRALAGADGPNLRIIDQDWGRSAATEKTNKRLAFLALMAQIEAGEVSTLYAFSADRLARSVQWSARLLDACEAAGTVIVTGEGRFAPGDDMARQMFHFQAMMNEGVLRQMTTKAREVASTRKARGDATGQPPYGFRHATVDGKDTLAPREGEDPQVVVDAFRRVGSYLRAAKLLNSPTGETVLAYDGSVIGTGIGLPTRGVGKRWDPGTVRHVVLRTAPELAPTHSHRGAPTRPTRLFARLLTCPHTDQHHPGSRAPLTSSSTQYRPRYLCRAGHFDVTHPRPYIVSEDKVLGWAKKYLADELGNHLEVEYAGEKPDVEARIAALDERRERVLNMYADGDISREEKTRRLAEIEAQRPAVESVRRVKTLYLRNAIDWDADPADINARLRELWDHVELDPATMLPVRAVWNIGKSPEEVFEAQAANETWLAQHPPEPSAAAKRWAAKEHEAGRLQA